jgi:aminoglycoside phosphotransferase (APT) family kinase protein
MQETQGIDQPKAIREGEELDHEALQAYIKEAAPTLPEPFSIEQFPSGHSNLTYMIRTGDQEWVLRRPPKGAKAIKKGHDMGREYRILSRLHDAYPKAPKPLLFCEDESIIGAPFYMMERVKGMILRNRPPKHLELTPERMKTLSEAAIDNLVDLHAVDIEQTGLIDIGKPEGYVERQITGWSERYQKAKTDEFPAMDTVLQWLPRHMPATSPAPTLIHNDYKYDNIVLAPDDIAQVTAVLDWEMATVGDPWMDVGTTLGYWITEEDPDELRMLPFGLTHLPGNLTRSEFVSRYAEKSGRDPQDIVFYYVYGTFKIAVIAQQIYFRYAKGFTKDPRFANFILAVNVLAQAGARAIERNSLDLGGSLS